MNYDLRSCDSRHYRELKFGTFVEKPYTLGCNSLQFFKTFPRLSFLFQFFAAEYWSIFQWQNFTSKNPSFCCYFVHKWRIKKSQTNLFKRKCNWWFSKVHIKMIYFIFGINKNKLIFISEVESLWIRKKHIIIS